jgi:hypothetical protein
MSPHQRIPNANAATAVKTLYLSSDHRKIQYYLGSDGYAITRSPGIEPVGIGIEMILANRMHKWTSQFFVPKY